VLNSRRFARASAPRAAPLEVNDGLAHAGDDRAVRAFAEADGLDLAAQHRPLAHPVRAHCLAAVLVPTVHTVRPDHAVGQAR
jgi:hypothetical protein